MHLTPLCFRLTLAIATLTASLAPAQEPDNPPPPAPAPGQVMPKMPIIPRAPVRAEWTMRIRENFDDSWESSSAWEAPADAEQRVIESIQITKDEGQKTYRMRTRWNDGEREDEWVVMGNHVAERAGGRGYYIVGAEASTAQELARADFPELSWVEMSHFRGLKKYKGKQVFAFEVPFDQKRLSADEQRMVEAVRHSDPTATPSKILKPKSDRIVLFLDPATQLPVLYNDGRTLRTYSFSQSPDSLTPPTEILNFLRARAEALRVRLTPPAGPGTP